jgi:hypothetical protein
MTTQGVDQLRALPDKRLVRSEGDSSGLVLGTLHGHIMQVWTQRRLSNRRYVCCIILLSLDKRLHIDRRKQTNLMAEVLREPAPMPGEGGIYPISSEPLLDLNDRRPSGEGNERVIISDSLAHPP